jgi:hypothetical protein
MSKEHDQLIHNMRMKGILLQYTNWVWNRLQGCCTRIQFDDVLSDPLDVDNGCDQGDLISVILYHFYNAGLIETARKSKGELCHDLFYLVYKTSDHGRTPPNIPPHTPNSEASPKDSLLDGSPSHPTYLGALEVPSEHAHQYSLIPTLLSPRTHTISHHYPHLSLPLQPPEDLNG